MFYGEHEHTLDRKGRLIIPSKFRQVFKEHDVETLYVTRGLDGCLFLFTEEEWQATESKFRAVSLTKAEARRFNRLYFSGASDLEIDRQGRILLPKSLKEFAQIKQDVIIIGVSNRIEIWARERWKAFYEATRPSFEETAERFLGE